VPNEFGDLAKQISRQSPQSFTWLLFLGVGIELGDSHMGNTLSIIEQHPQPHHLRKILKRNKVRIVK
jgi:hypothetical protein